MKKLLAIVFTMLAMLAVSLSFGQNGNNAKIVRAKDDKPKPLPPEQKPLPPKPTMPEPTPRPEPKPMPGPSKP